MRTSTNYSLVVLFSCLCLLPVTGVAGAGENVQDVGRQLLSEQRYAEAYDHLFAAFELQPDDADINFLLGRAAFEKGDFESALMAFDRVLIIHPGAVRVKLELARCHIALGAFGPARQLLAEVLESKPPAAVKDNIQLLTDSMDAKQKRSALHGSLALGFAGDDNVEATPNVNQINYYGFVPSPILVSIADQKTSDLLYFTTLTADHSYRFDKPGANWKTSLLHYTGTYQSFGSELNTQYLGVTSGPTWQLPSGGNLELHPLFTQMDLDSDGYLHTLGGEGRFSWPLAANCLLQFGAKVEDKQYVKDTDSARDALTTSATFDELLQFGATRLTIGLSGEWEEAAADWLTYDRYGVGLRLEHALANRLNLWASGHLFGSLYDAVDQRFAQTRSDQIWTFATGLRQGLWAEQQRRIDLDLGYTYTNANANIDLYTYDKTVVSCNLTFFF